MVSCTKAAAMRDVVRAIKAVAAKIPWPRFVISLVFCLTLTAMKLATDWSALARDIITVAFFVLAAFLIEFAYGCYADWRERPKKRTERHGHGPESRQS
jgi:ABC-type uncharacterized transport system permease subunit